MNFLYLLVVCVVLLMRSIVVETVKENAPIWEKNLSKL